VSEIVRLNELQSWFVGEHLAARGPSQAQQADAT
jgi:hypothetical protein